MIKFVSGQRQASSFSEGFSTGIGLRRATYFFSVVVQGVVLLFTQSTTLETLHKGVFLRDGRRRDYGSSANYCIRALNKSFVVLFPSVSEWTIAILLV